MIKPKPHTLQLSGEFCDELAPSWCSRFTYISRAYGERGRRHQARMLRHYKRVVDAIHPILKNATWTLDHSFLSSWEKQLEKAKAAKNRKRLEHKVNVIAEQIRKPAIPQQSDWYTVKEASVLWGGKPGPWRIRKRCCEWSLRARKLPSGQWRIPRSFGMCPIPS